MIHNVTTSYMRLSRRIPEQNEIYRARDRASNYRYKMGDGRTPLRDLPWMLNGEIPPFVSRVNLYDILKQVEEESKMTEIDERELLSIIS